MRKIHFIFALIVTGMSMGLVYGAFTRESVIQGFNICITLLFVIGSVTASVITYKEITGRKRSSLD